MIIADFEVSTNLDFAKVIARKRRKEKHTKTPTTFS
jgi:hypothetical protein